MALIDNLIAAWSLNGTANDSFGTNNLTLNNSPSYTTGLVHPQALNCVRASTQSGSVAANSNLSIGTNQDFSVLAWVNLASRPTFAAIAGQDDYGTGSRAWNLNYDGGPQRFTIETFSTSGGFRESIASNVGLPATGTWYMVAATYDHTSTITTISVNAGTANTDTGQTSIKNSTAPFRIGSLTSNGSGTSSEAWDGIIGPVLFWKRVISSTEITQLYNSGNGLILGKYAANNFYRRLLGI